VTEERSDRSIISNLRGFTWSTGESVAYEAAVEAINGAVGAYSAVIAAEEVKKNPSQRFWSGPGPGRLPAPAAASNWTRPITSQWRRPGRSSLPCPAGSVRAAGE